MRQRSRTGGGPKAQRRKTAARKTRITPKAVRTRSPSAAREETKVARLTRERDEALEQTTVTTRGAKSQHRSQTMYRRRDLRTWSSLQAQAPAIRTALGHRARSVVLQLLAALRDEIGSLDKVVRFGRVFGMVNAVPRAAQNRHKEFFI
jgi:hypothetical protein